MGIFKYRELLKRIVGKGELFRKGDRILAGVSGGADSVALLHVLLDLKESCGISVGVAHMNHMLRGVESDRDESFVRDLAERLDLPFYLERADVKGHGKRMKLSLEEAARTLRYDFFWQTAEKHQYDRVAVGHHADDNAELLLMQIIRGSGSTGLSGMPRVRSGNLLRPLIQLTREEILGILEYKGAEYVDDSSNMDTAFLRNRIRLNLLPRLKDDFNPSIVDALNRLADVVSCEESYLEDITRGIFNEITAEPADGRIDVDRKKLLELHPAAQRRLVRLAFKSVKGDLRRISLGHVDQVIEFAGRESGAGTLDFPGRVRVRLGKEALCFVREKAPLRSLGKKKSCPEGGGKVYNVEKPGSSRVEILLPEAGARMVFTETVLPGLQEVSSSSTVCFLPLVGLSFPLVVRYPEPGDIFRPCGMGGRSQSLKKYFSSAAVPQQLRRKCPLVVSSGEIVWVAGYRPAQKALVREPGAKVVKVELFLA